MEVRVIMSSKKDPCAGSCLYKQVCLQDDVDFAWGMMRTCTFDLMEKSEWQSKLKLDGASVNPMI